MSRNPQRKPLLSEPGPALSPLLAPAQPPAGAWRMAVPLLFVLYVIFAGLHALWVPVGQTGYQNAPDEAAHVTYVRALAGGHLPTQALADTDPTGKSYEWHQPPLYYAWAALFLPLGLHGMRLASILLGVVCLILLYQCVRLLLPQEPLVAISALGIAALLPTHIAITSTINNDVLLEACFSAALLLLLQCLLRGLTPWRAGCLGIALGLALLTKSTALLLLPVIVVGSVLMRRGGETNASLIRAAALVGIWATLLSGWWFVRNLRVYGELLPLKAFDRAFAHTALAKDLMPVFGGVGGYAQRVALWTFKSFWAVYGNPRYAMTGNPIFLPDQIYLLPLFFVVAVLVGMARLHFQRDKLFVQAQLAGLWLLMTTLALVALSFALFLTKYFQTQGRYLFPAMTPICALMALGWLAVFPAKYKSLAAACLLGWLLVMALLFLSVVQAAS